MVYSLNFKTEVLSMSNVKEICRKSWERAEERFNGFLSKNPEVSNEEASQEANYIWQDAYQDARYRAGCPIGVEWEALQMEHAKALCGK